MCPWPQMMWKRLWAAADVGTVCLRQWARGCCTQRSRAAPECVDLPPSRAGLWPPPLCPVDAELAALLLSTHPQPVAL